MLEDVRANGWSLRPCCMVVDSIPDNALVVGEKARVKVKNEDITV